MSVSPLLARDHRANARAMLGGNIFANNWLMGLVVMLIYTAVISLVSTFTFAIATLILTGPLLVGVYGCFLSASRMGKLGVDGILDGFQKDFLGAFLTHLMVSIFTFLWSLLFIIPGIIKSYAYSMSLYIKVDHPEYDWKQCMDESQRIMDGNKWKLFCLQISFIGWAIVCGFTFGIGLLWLNPYMQAATVSFYESIKE